MRQPERVTKSQLLALMLLASHAGSPDKTGINSAALDDDILTACFDLVTQGLAEEVPCSDGTVWFRITERGQALHRLSV